MDQVRAALGWLQRQHFWVLSVLVALIAVAGWWTAAGRLAALYNTNTATIKAGFSEIDSVRNAPFHPNEVINTRQTQENETQLKSVATLWQQLYDKQRAEVLKWPTALSQEFRDAVEKLNFNDDIPAALRNNYQNYIEQHFPDLPKRIGARAIDINAATGALGGGEYARGPGGYGQGGYGEGGMPGMPGMPDDDDSICEWLPADQQYIRDELNFPQRPSSLRIWVTQEDLWVYHTLLNTIAKTNQAVGATRRSNAAIQTVISIEVGSRAAFSSRTPGRLLVPPAVASAAGPGMEGEAPAPGPGPGPGGPGEGRGEMGMTPGMGLGAGLTPGAAMPPAVEQGVLMSYRYLDDKGQPIPVGGGAAAGEAGLGPAPTPDPAAAATADAPPLDLAQFGAAYKRLPVRMVLRMDVRKLPLLITACANEPLRVEVQEVRINPSDASSMAGGMMGGMGGGMRGGYGEGGPGRGSYGGIGGGALGGGIATNLFPDRTGIQVFSARPFESTVVIQGIIYIFNKPNLKNLAPAGEQPVAVN